MLMEDRQGLLPYLLQSAPLHRDHDAGEARSSPPLEGSGIAPVTDQELDPAGAVVRFALQERLEVASPTGSENRDGDAHVSLPGGVSGQLSPIVTHQERIGPSLPAYSSLGPVAREESGLVREAEHFAMDGLHELVEITPNQVRPSNGPLKDHVPHEGHLLCRQMEDHVARRMTRSEAHVDVASAEGEDVAVRQLPIRWWEGPEGGKVEGSGLSLDPVIEATIAGVEIDGSFRSDLPDGRDPFDVIQMRMGEEDRFQRNPRVPNVPSHGR
jgi:hypothetical protein